MSEFLVILHDSKDKSPEGRNALAQKIAERFSISEKQVAALLSKPPVVLKRGLSLAQARALGMLLEKFGGVSEILEESSPSLQLGVEEEEIEAKSAKASKKKKSPKNTKKPPVSTSPGSEFSIEELESMFDSALSGKQDSEPQTPAPEDSGIALELESSSPGTSQVSSPFEFTEDSAASKAENKVEEIKTAFLSLDEGRITEPQHSLAESDGPAADSPRSEQHLGGTELEMVSKLETPAEIQPPPPPLKPYSAVLETEAQAPSQQPDAEDGEDGARNRLSLRDNRVQICLGALTAALIAAIVFFMLQSSQDDVDRLMSEAQIQNFLRAQKERKLKASEQEAPVEASPDVQVYLWKGLTETGGLKCEASARLEDGSLSELSLNIEGEEPGELSRQDFARGIRREAWIRRAEIVMAGAEMVVENAAKEQPISQFSGSGSARIYAADDLGAERFFAPYSVQGQIAKDQSLISGKWELGEKAEISSESHRSIERKPNGQFRILLEGSFRLDEKTLMEGPKEPDIKEAAPK